MSFGAFHEEQQCLTCSSTRCSTAFSCRRQLTEHNPVQRESLDGKLKFSELKSESNLIEERRW